MNDSTHASLERLSALADGELRGDELSQTLAAVATDAALRDQWRSYHMVGEVLRTGRHVPCSDSQAFLARLNQQIAAQAPDLAQALTSTPAPASKQMPAAGLIRPQPEPLPQLHRVRAEAANEPVFRWKMVAGLACVAAAAAIGWTWVGAGFDAPGAGGQLALEQQAPTPMAAAGGAGTASVLASAPVTQTRVSVGGGPQIMLRDPRLDELLEAHQQAVGASQMPSGFLRNATFEGAGR